LPPAQPLETNFRKVRIPGTFRFRAGVPCRAAARPGERFCAFHNPDRAEQQQSARAAGGRGSWNKRLSLRQAEGTAAGEVLAYLSGIMDELRQPGASPDDVARLRAAVYCASVALKAIEVAETDVEVRQLQERLDEAEANHG